MEANASRMICAKCGTQNAAGDAFCGSCGAFLEFAAEEAGSPGTAAAEPQPGVPTPVQGALPTAAAPPPVGAAPAVAAPPPAPQAPAPVAAAVPAVAPSLAPSGPTCPACGRANPAGRTFCISCGERLPAAGRVTTAGARPGTASHPAAGPLAAAPLAGSPRPTAPVPLPPAALASAPAATAAPAAPSQPAAAAWEFPTAPTRPVVPPGARPGAGPETPAPATTRRRGGSPLPLIVGVGILFLVLAGGGAAVLLGGKPGPAASAPVASDGSAAASAALPSASAAAASAGGASFAPSAAPATLPPGPSIGLTLTAATASSSLAGHPASAATDNDQTTAWKTGGSDPSDQWIEVMFAPAAVTRVQLWNGWQRTQDYFAGNRRPKDVTLRFDSETPIPLKLVDVYGSQRVDIPPELGIVGVTRLRITILDWYPAKKTPAAGSPTTQAAISEIRLYGIPVNP